MTFDEAMVGFDIRVDYDLMRELWDAAQDAIGVDLKAKDDQITELNVKIKSIRDTAFEMIAMQTSKITNLERHYIELDGSYMASQACNEKQRVRIMELEKNV